MRGDTLANPAFLENDELKKFNVILANPPYSIKAWDRASFENDPYGRNMWGTPPQNCADYAFEQHIHKSMDPNNGRCVQLWPHGILQRISEKHMRINMIKSGTVEAVIGLGPNLFYNSAMDSCLLVRNTRKSSERKGKVIFIDAFELIIAEKNNTHLSIEHQTKIFEAYSDFNDQEGFAIVKTEEDILANEGSLKITDYLKRSANMKNALPFSEALKTWETQSLILNDSMNQLFKRL